MKTFGIILCNVAIALGILAGRSDYLREVADTAEADRAAAERERLAAEAQAAAALATRRDRLPPRRRAGPPTSGPTDDMIAPLASSSAGGSERARPSGGPSEDLAAVEGQGGAGPLAELGAFRGRLDVVQEMLFRRDYAAAEAAARALAAETANGPISAHDRALQLEAKARAFRRLLGSATPGPAQGSGGQGAPRKEKTLVAEVLLANGTRFEAKLLEERADAYVFRLFNGGRFAPRKEDVLEVRQVEREVALGADWTELQPKIAALSHPIDIFVDGVQRLLRLGLERQGLEILEKLLERPDSDQVPLLFVGDSDEGLLRDWQVAAGRRRPAGTAPDEVASAGEPPGARSDEGASAPAGTAAEADLASLTQARRLAEEAQALYQGAAGKEGKEADLRTARERLAKAREILEGLPPEDEGVRKLRRQVAQLTSDVARVSTF